MYRKIALSFLAVLLLPALVLAAPDGVARVTGRPDMQTTVPTGRIVMRLAPDSGLRGGLEGIAVNRGAKASATSDAQRLTGLVADLAAGAEIESRFPSFSGDKSASGRPGPDMGLYVHFDARTLDRDVLVKMVARLNADPAVDLAYLEPVAVPAALGFDALTGGLDLPALPSASFDSLQGYMEEAPDGIGALSMRGQAGALGAGLSVIDVEGAWLWSHEDLPVPLADIGTHFNDLGWRNHGTAVVGVIRGEDNAYGVTGITPSCGVGSSSVGGSQSTAQAILSAAAVLAPGDVIVIELHAPGPEATGVGQQGYVPMEFWQDIFDAIQVVTAQGLIVCEAAGNGSVDLDASLYAGMFDRTLRDSGAIMIGATNGKTLGPAWFSNNGTRVDLNGWGYDVTTLAYGDLQGDPDFPEEQWYTAQFSGTSSATPIVTGAVVGLQGMVRAHYGMDLDARLARDILLATGTPTSGPQLIGNRPNMVAAWALADSAIGAVGGTVTDQLSGLPVDGVLVQVAGGGSWTLTAADGTWYLPLLTGPVDFDFTLFGYHAEMAGTVITMGTVGTLDVALTAGPQVDITGTVYGGSLPLSGALVTPLVHPVSSTTSGVAGDYTLTVSGGEDYLLRFDGVPGYGARVVAAPVMLGDFHLSPGLDSIEEDFETDDGGFTGAQGLWTHGTPPGAVVGNAFSGANCWGIGMDGLGYEDAQTDTLTSTYYNLVPLAGTGYYQLSFHFWSATEAGFDGVQVLASSNTFDWEPLTPIEGFTDNFLGGLGQQPGWSGHSGRWQGTVFDITDYVGGLFQFKLVFGSDGGVTDDGFFIDGIAFGEGKNATAVPDGPVPGARTASLKAWPNPFNPRVNIAWKMPLPGHLKVAVFDLRGRRVRVLQDDVTGVREGVLTWDGRDAGGRAAASGVYLVQMRGAGGTTASQRVVLAK